MKRLVNYARLHCALGRVRAEGKACAGEMSDAAEVLGTIYEQLAVLPRVSTLVTHVFELPVREAVHCQACGKDTHQSSFVQSFYCVSATALRMQGMLAVDDNEGVMPPLGQLLLVSLLHGTLSARIF